MCACSSEFEKIDNNLYKLINPTENINLRKNNVGDVTIIAFDKNRLTFLNGMCMYKYIH